MDLRGGLNFWRVRKSGNYLNSPESVNSLEMVTRGTTLKQIDRRSGSEVKKQRAEEAFGTRRDAGGMEGRRRHPVLKYDVELYCGSL